MEAVSGHTSRQPNPCCARALSRALRPSPLSAQATASTAEGTRSYHGAQQEHYRSIQPRGEIGLRSEAEVRILTVAVGRP